MSNTEWLVAKFIPDLRRREPQNIGVVVYVDGQAFTRFLGDREDGQIDGRRVRWTQSVDTYKAWVRYWRKSISQLEMDALLECRADDSFYLEYGGERLLGDPHIDPEELADDLYAKLVEDIGVAPLSITGLAEGVFSTLGIQDRIQRDIAFDAAVMGNPVDRVRFDYRFDNGQTSLMQRVSLLVGGERAWNAAHSAAWSFDRALDQLQTVHPQGVQLIALVRTPDDRDSRQQVGVLNELATVVDLDDEKRALGEMRNLLHV